MENDKIEQTNDTKDNSIAKIMLVILGIIFIIFLITFGVIIFNNSRILHFDSFDVTCQYKAKFNKIVCTQIGDVVPEWLDLDDAPLLKYLGGGDSVYTMKLIFSHSNKDYKVLNMTDREFIKDRNRKFIYELKEQTYGDWIEFKRYTQTGSIGNWGSILLYCSEDNLKDDICKRMKKNHK